MFWWLVGGAALFYYLKGGKKYMADSEYKPTRPIEGQAWVKYATKKHGLDFVYKSDAIAKKHNITLGELFAIFMHESSMSASIANFLGCVGLIQFCPDYRDKKGRLRKRGASFVGKTTAELKAMSAIEQLDYVDLYITKWSLIKKPRQGHEAEDINMLIFHPAVMGREDKYSAQDKKYLNGYYAQLKKGKGK